MIGFIGKRVVQTVIVLLLVSFFSFLLLYLIPGDPVSAVIGENATKQQYEETYNYMGLDKPFIVRYINWLWNVLHGDFGMSFKFNKPVAEIIASRIPVTFYFTIIALLTSTFVGIVLGIFTAVNKGTWKDTLVTAIANIGTCTPMFWLGIVLILIFSVKLRLLPAFGFVWPWEDFGESIKQTILPVVCLGIVNLSVITRQTRSSMLEVVRQDYIRTARSKGLKEINVIYGHALKNTMVTIVTLMGMKIGVMIGTSVFIESVFQLPGLGQLIIYSVASKDFFMLQACVLIVSLVFCTSNFIVDLLYGYIDPRIRVNG